MSSLQVDAMAALETSLTVALACLALSTIPAVGLGWLLARREFPGKTALSALLYTPIVLPPVVTGYVLLLALGRRSAIGGWLEHTLGLTVSFTWLGAVIAAAVVGFPLFVMTVRVAIENVDVRLEQTARVHGASALGAFLRVTLPIAGPGVIAGAVLAFARALGEFGATAVLAGNIEGQTRTLALAVYTLLDDPRGDSAAAFLTALSLVVSLVAVGGYEWLNRRGKRLREEATLGPRR